MWCTDSLVGFSYPAACGILVSQPGIDSASPALEDRFLTTGPPGKSPPPEFLNLWMWSRPQECISNTLSGAAVASLETVLLTTVLEQVSVSSCAWEKLRLQMQSLGPLWSLLRGGKSREVWPCPWTLEKVTAEVMPVPMSSVLLPLASTRKDPHSDVDPPKPYNGFSESGAPGHYDLRPVESVSI